MFLSFYYKISKLKHCTFHPFHSIYNFAQPQYQSHNIECISGSFQDMINQILIHQKYLIIPIQMFKIFTSLLYNRQLFKPNAHIPSVLQLQGNTAIQEFLENVQVFLFDKDDTLVPLHEFEVKDIKVIETLHSLRKKGKKLFIISNSVREKGKKLRYSMDKNIEEIELIYTSEKKPFNGEQVHEILSEKLGMVKRKEIAIVGDRKMTDIYLGKVQGWKTILVDPIEKSSIGKHGLGVYMMRKVENCLL